MEFWFYVIWATLAVATFFVGGIYLYSKNEDKKKRPDPVVDPVTVTVTPSVKLPVSIPTPTVDNEISEDQRYAAAHDLWICAYCETLNKCPPGMKRKKTETVEIRPSSALKGAMAKKAVADSVPEKSERPVCVACGKYLDSVS